MADSIFDPGMDHLIGDALHRWDSLPIIHVVETQEKEWENADGELEVYTETYTIDVDLAKAAKAVDWDDFRTRYVYGILEAAIAGKTEHSTSKKYSFSDTTDWWADITAESTEGRQIVNIDVEIWS